MNPIELRTLIRWGLVQKAGMNYGDIFRAEPISPVPGEPVQLRVTTWDPDHKPRVYVVSITEETPN